MMTRYRIKHGVHVTWIRSSGIRAYIRKDFAKNVQKGIPKGFENVGRVWGHSRGVSCHSSVVQTTEEKIGGIMELYLAWCERVNIRPGMHKLMGVTMWELTEAETEWLHSIIT